MTESFSQPSLEPPPSTEEEQLEEEAGSPLVRVVVIASVVLIGLVVGIFVIALLIAQGDVEKLAPIIQIVRDLVIILLALEGILIILALAVLIVQVARLINLLQNEFKPILQNTQDTLKSAKGTIDFVGDNVAEPVIRASSFFAGLGVLVGNLIGIRRAIRRSPDAPAPEGSADEPEQTV